jgi:oligopeptide transport system substrate-binding protein
MSSYLKELRAFALGAALAFATAGAVTGAAAAQSALRIANTGEPRSLDPHAISGTWEGRVTGELFMGLTTEDADGRPIPGSAESWTINGDGTVYTFKLRPGLVWSDGRSVTADDFVYSLRRILDPATAARYASLLFPIKNGADLNGKKTEGMEKLGVRAVDPATLEITLENPTPYFLDLLSHFTAYPVPRHVIERHGNEWTRPANIVGNGPYVLREWTPQTQIVMEKNPRFFDAANVKIDRVVFFPTEDRATILRQFRAGEVDFATDFPTDQIDWLRQNMARETRIVPFLGIYYFPINTQKKPFDDVRVREALSLAIDRSVITDRILRAGEVPATSFVPPGLANYTPATVPGFTDSQEVRERRALELMRAAGFGPDRPLKLELSFNTSEAHRRVSVAMAAMWKKLGVEAELTNADVGTHYNNLEKGNYDVGRAAWIADYPDPQNFLFLYQETTAHNYSRYKDPRFDALMARAARTTDPVARGRVLQEAEALALAAFTNIPIYYYVSRNLVSLRVEGFKDNATNIHRVRWMSLK